MASGWYSLPTLATGDVLRVGTFQDMWRDLDTLKRPPYAEQYCDDAPGNPFQNSSTTFADINGTFYVAGFETYGNPVEIHTSMYAFNNLANGGVFFTFLLDGTVLGNSLGLGRFNNTDGFEVFRMWYVAEDLPAGSHTLTVQDATAGAGTAQIIRAACFKTWVKELN